MAIIAATPSLLSPPVLSIWSLESIGVELRSRRVVSTASDASATWPSANLAIYVPFVLYEPYIVTQLFTFNGATAANNIDIGIYDAAGTKIVSSGSTAQSGTTTLQLFDITDTLLGAGQFYFALAMNGTSGTIRRFTDTSGLGGAFGMLQQGSAFALPATATFAAYSQSYIPIMGMTNRTVL